MRSRTAAGALSLLMVAACLSAQKAPPKSELPPRPDPLLCLLEWFSVDDDGSILGCPPDPEPLLGDRPCAADDGTFTRHFFYDSEGRPTLITAPTRADGLKGGGEHRFVYDPAGRLTELRGIFMTPTTASVRHERSHVLIAFEGSERRFELAGGRLSSFAIWLAAGEKGPVKPVARYRFQDHAEERIATIELPGPKGLSRQGQSRVQYVDHRPSSLKTVIGEWYNHSSEFIYEGSRLVRIEHGSYRTTVHYDCPTSQDAGR